MQIGYRYGRRHIALGVHREAPGQFAVTIDGEPRTVGATLIDSTTVLLTIDEQSHVAYVARIGGVDHVCIDGEVYALAPEAAAPAAEHGVLAIPQIVAPMPGKILQVLVAAGQSVGPGDGLVILEAMKMEHRIPAPAAATVVAVNVGDGQMVDGGTVLIELSFLAP